MENKNYIDEKGFLTKEFLDDFRQELGYNLKMYREKLYPTIADSAKASGLTHPTAQTIEEGLRNYTIDNLLRHLAVLDCSLVVVQNSYQYKQDQEQEQEDKE